MTRKRQLEPIFEGFHNANLEATRERLLRSQTYKDLSTIMIVVTRGMIPAKVVWSWLGLMIPMNQKFYRLPPVEGMEVGDGYNAAVEMILNNPELAKWKYLLTVEEDNCPQPDSLLKLYEAMEMRAVNTGNKLDVIQGLYFTKGSEGMPMIYGDPHVMPKNYVPQVPLIDALQESNGLGMGFNLWRLEQFKKVPKPWFKTVQEVIPGQGARAATQDMFYFDQAARFGYKFGCYTKVKIGHWDQQNAMLW
jgi:hypothetical protein